MFPWRHLSITGILPQQQLLLPRFPPRLVSWEGENSRLARLRKSLRMENTYRYMSTSAWTGLSCKMAVRVLFPSSDEDYLFPRPRAASWAEPHLRQAEHEEHDDEDVRPQPGPRGRRTGRKLRACLFVEGSRAGAAEEGDSGGGTGRRRHGQLPMCQARSPQRVTAVFRMRAQQIRRLGEPANRFAHQDGPRVLAISAHEMRTPCRQRM